MIIFLFSMMTMTMTMTVVHQAKLFLVLECAYRLAVILLTLLLPQLLLQQQQETENLAHTQATKRKGTPRYTYAIYRRGGQLRRNKLKCDKLQRQPR